MFNHFKSQTVIGPTDFHSLLPDMIIAYDHIFKVILELILVSSICTPVYIDSYL